MRRMLAALGLAMLTAMVGCVEDAKVEKGGGESVVLVVVNGRPTGAIEVRGHVVNSGKINAQDVELTFKFFDAGTLYLEQKLVLGSIPAGDSKDFSGVFHGPPVNAATFTWDYEIDWD